MLDTSVGNTLNENINSLTKFLNHLLNVIKNNIHLYYIQYLGTYAK